MTGIERTTLRACRNATRTGCAYYPGLSFGRYALRLVKRGLLRALPPPQGGFELTDAGRAIVEAGERPFLFQIARKK